VGWGRKVNKLTGSGSCLLWGLVVDTTSCRVGLWVYTPALAAHCIIALRAPHAAACLPDSPPPPHTHTGQPWPWQGPGRSGGQPVSGCVPPSQLAALEGACCGGVLAGGWGGPRGGGSTAGHGGGGGGGAW
jgi:hypothetical protein